MRSRIRSRTDLILIFNNKAASGNRCGFVMSEKIFSEFHKKPELTDF